ncbi:hypothetical protein M422DRAFT_49473 [Sphaerobolus stellatus SS14]|uniref:Unplaced genomic scaffold SPHSTscaffold_73, whole genome shotgun sequence n=1 Tax=Sphaerobolus stellatus (strain SS14) TaxID=990650 RepID=A0A0C9UA47_SPHS4|nr:hypothetical protein M422DRAFT_49473 [Sphaerobolus stellatus SS14]
MTIARHEFKPIQLYKLDPLGKEAFKAKTFEFSEDGVTQRDREPTSKDYPTQRSLFQPFGCYLQLLHHFVIAAGNTDNSLAVVYATLDYVNQLHAYAAKYEWNAVLKYHFEFHSARLAEMREGNFSGWQAADQDLVNLYLTGNTKVQNKPSTGSSASLSFAKQVCNKFQEGKCQTPCPMNRQHQCRAC